MRVSNWRILILFITVGLILAGALIGSALLVQDKDKSEQVDTTYLTERLKTAIENSVKRGRIIGYNLNEEMFKPISGLDNPDVVPFLIDFIENGPNLPGQKKLPLESYIECCYATLCLGYIGDKRAYEPLVKVMQEENYHSVINMKSVHIIRTVGL